MFPLSEEFPSNSGRQGRAVPERGIVGALNLDLPLLCFVALALGLLSHGVH